MIRKHWPELGIIILLLLLPLLLFAPVSLGAKTILPVDNLFLFEPYRSAAPEFGISYPHNHLLSDLILENYVWKRFFKQSIQNRELPLWDPYIFSGHPFLANGQHSGLYPLSLVFYILPLWRAFGVFAWLQLGIAGVFAYLFARVLGIQRVGSLSAGITFQLSGFMLVSVVHPMIIAGASWLPFILAMIELIIKQRPALSGRPATLPWALLGALGLGCQMLAGHAENTYFVLLVAAFYAAWRLSGKLTNQQTKKAKFTRRLYQLQRPVLWISAMVALGLALGAIQFIPLYEVASTSFRGGEEAASLAQVRDWAYPWRRLITFGVPNFFGNPSHHSYFDLFTGRRTPAPVQSNGRYIDWGIKNYVEGGAYLGVLPLFLAGIAIISWLKPYVLRLMPAASRFTPTICNTRSSTSSAHRTIPFFSALSLFSLGCIFGTPLYALVYALPLLKQSHSPFRWVFPLTLSVAVLTGFGTEAVQKSRKQRSKAQSEVRQGTQSAISKFFFLNTSSSLVSLLASSAFWGGVATLVGLMISRAFFGQLEPLVEAIFLSLAKAPSAFPDHRAFYSYEFKWIALFGLLLTGTGIVLRVSRCPIYLKKRPVWEFLAVGFIVLDLLIFGVGFYPALDPALLDYTPPVVDFLRQDESLWRYATFTPPGTTKTMNANTGMFYGLQCVEGYDSIFSAQYRDYMRLIEPQGETQYNRIASFHQRSSLDSPLTDLLNVKYVITEVKIGGPKYNPIYEGEAVRVYENLGAMPRAFTLPASATVTVEDFGTAVQEYDPREYVLVESGDWPHNKPFAPHNPQPASHVAQPVTHYSHNEVFVDATVHEPGWLVLADSYTPGWKAFVRPQEAGEEAEREVEIARVNGNFRGVPLDEPGAWTVRFKYTPDSVKIGAFISFIAGMTLLFMTGIYLWRLFYREEDNASTVKRVAKNSLAPIVLNLFNRVIDFAFAALMARILGPVGNGRYFTAVAIYGWFDIIANFGLDMYLMREVARDRSCARRTFVNATGLRLLLFIAVIPVLGGFLAGRQALGQPMVSETIWTIALLYAGLLPGTIANSLTALFRACEKHEIPAATQTVTTIVKVTLGTLALVGGLGIIGLAGASILTNVVTTIILTILTWQLIWPALPKRRIELSWPLQRKMVSASWPLMSSLLLQSIFTGANVVLLQYFQGDQAVGWYNAASKWVMNMLNIVPSLFTFAVFPIMSRQADEDRGRLRRSYGLSLKLLTIIALPTAMMVTLLATPLVQILSGAQFLPHGAIALRLLVWSILFGWANSLTNYVLIALNRQRYVVLASGARVVFAVTANLLLVDRFSYIASAWIIIGGELLMALLFQLDLRHHLEDINWKKTLARPALSGLAMGATALVLVPHNRPLAMVASVAIYSLALIGLRALTPDELAMLAPLVPRMQRILDFIS
jgi:O-antigen/teichoic acid export membrane protein